MNTKSNTSVAVIERQKTVDVKEWIVRIGIVFILLAFLISILVVNFKYLDAPQPDPNTNLGRLVWDSVFSIPSGAVFFVDLIASILLLCFAKRLRKGRVICMSVLFFVMATFDNIAIRYPLQQEWIALVSLVAFIICAIIVLLQKQTKTYISKDNNFGSRAITKALGNTDNRSIIAAQLYKVQTSQVLTATRTERIRFDVSHIGNDFVRAGYDVNSISRISYELDRDIVDSFPIILRLYHQFRKNCDDNTKSVLLNTINEKISVLEAKLQTIDALQRPVTKDDCCIARALTIFLSFKYILCPPPGVKASQDDYIGEISLHDGDLNLSPETEAQLFSLYRTGILGAALLDNNLRHVFHYRKEGAKNGRKYSVSQVVCETGTDTNNFSAQTMYICLFTIKESTAPFIPGYMFRSISEREEEITNVLNKMRKGGEISGQF